MRNILLTALNTVRVTFRVRSRIMVYFLVPLFGVVVSFFINGGGANQLIRVGIVDGDATAPARHLVESLQKTGRFQTPAVAPAELNRRIAEGALDCGLVIPEGYGAGVLAGAPPAVSIVSIQGKQITAWLEEYARLYSSTASALAVAAGGDPVRFEALYAEASARGARLDVEKLRDASAGRATTVLSVGYLVFFLILGAGITGNFVLEDRRIKTFARIKSAPVRAGQYIAGNGLAGFLIVVAQIILVMLVMKLVFRIETFVPDLLLFAILFVFGFAAVGAAMAITAFSRSTFVSTILLNLILTPTCMIAGCFWRVEFMPQFLQKLSLFFPQRWVLDAVQKAQAGAGLGEIALNLVVIAGFALVLFLAASLRFARLEESGQFV